MDFNEFLFHKLRTQEAHENFGHCQHLLQAYSIAHGCCTDAAYKLRSGIRRPKTSNFLTKRNTNLYKSTTAEDCDFQRPTTMFCDKLCLALTIMQSELELPEDLTIAPL